MFNFVKLIKKLFINYFSFQFVLEKNIAFICCYFCTEFESSCS